MCVHVCVCACVHVHIHVCLKVQKATRRPVGNCQSKETQDYTNNKHVTAVASVCYCLYVCACINVHIDTQDLEKGTAPIEIQKKSM